MIEVVARICTLPHCFLRFVLQFFEVTYYYRNYCY